MPIKIIVSNFDNILCGEKVEIISTTVFIQIWEIIFLIFSHCELQLRIWIHREDSACKFSAGSADRKYEFALPGYQIWLLTRKKYE